MVSAYLNRAAEHRSTSFPAGRSSEPVFHFRTHCFLYGLRITDELIVIHSKCLVYERVFRHLSHTFRSEQYHPSLFFIPRSPTRSPSCLNPQRKRFTGVRVHNNYIGSTLIPLSYYKPILRIVFDKWV